MFRLLPVVTQSLVTAFELSGEVLRAFLLCEHQRSAQRMRAKIRASRLAERQLLNEQEQTFRSAWDRMVIDNRAASRMESQRLLRTDSYRYRLHYQSNEPGNVLDFCALESDWAQVGGDIERSMQKVKDEEDKSAASSLGRKEGLAHA